MILRKLIRSILEQNNLSYCFVDIIKDVYEGAATSFFLVGKISSEFSITIGWSALSSCFHRVVELQHSTKGIFKVNEQ